MLLRTTPSTAQQTESCLRTVDIAFINGMWCGDTCSLNAATDLSRQLSDRGGRPPRVVLLRNPGRFLSFQDVIEGAIQVGLLAEDRRTFWFALAGTLAVSSGAPVPAALGFVLNLQAGVSRIDALRNSVLSDHLTYYRDDVFARGKSVVVAGHSQGNFFANEEYASLDALERQFVGVVAIGTPDDYVAGAGPWTTLHEDRIIDLVRNILPATLQPNVSDPGVLDVDWLGHELADSYLADASPQRSSIVGDIFGEVDRLCVARCIQFSDDFNRPDSDLLGDDWVSAPSIGGDPLLIRDGKLTDVASIDGFAGVHRPYALARPVRLRARVEEASGAAGAGRRYQASFRHLSDGTAGSGFGIKVVRSDPNFDNSAIELVDGSLVLARIESDFQFGPYVDVDATISPDGSVDGQISDATSASAFSFGPRSILSTGSNFSYFHEFPDSRNPSPLHQRLDSISLTCADDISDTITIDGRFSDWANSQVLLVDPDDPIPSDESNLDIIGVRIAEDESYLFALIEFAPQQSDLGTSRYLNLLIDTDDDLTTGESQVVRDSFGTGGAIGWEFAVSLSSLTYGIAHTPHVSMPPWQGPVQLPTAGASDLIEIAIPKSILAPLQGDTGTITMLIATDGERDVTIPGRVVLGAD